MRRQKVPAMQSGRDTKAIALPLMIAAAMALVIACRGDEPRLASDVATVEAAVYSTRTAERQVDATVEAAVYSTRTAERQREAAIKSTAATETAA